MSSSTTTIALIEGKAPVSCLNPQVLKKLF